MTDSKDKVNIKPFCFKKTESASQSRRLKEIHLDFAQKLNSLLKNAGIKKVNVVFLSFYYSLSDSPDVGLDESKLTFNFNLAEGQKGRMEIDQKICSELIFYLLGYKKEEGLSPEKFTKIEKSALIGLIQDILEELQNSWEEDLKIENKVCEIEKSTLRKEELVFIRFSLEIVDVKGELVLTYPSSAINGFVFKPQDLDPEEREKIKELLEDSEVDLSCVLGEAQLSLTQVTDLRKGDVIILDQKLNQESKLKIQGNTKFRGVPGVFQGKKGMKIIQIS